MKSTAADWYVQHLLVLRLIPALQSTVLCVALSKDIYKQEISNKQHMHAYAFSELPWTGWMDSKHGFHVGLAVLVTVQY